MIMKRFIYISVLFVGCLVWSSCEKVIDVKLDTAPNQMVIEGNITDQNEAQLIKISQSVPYTDKNVFPAVKGAKVTVTDDIGHLWTFEEREPGSYSSAPFKGISGRTYSLKVNVSSTEYVASSTMPERVHMDSLSLKVFTFGGNDVKQLQVHYHDPAAEVNQYRWIMKIDNIQTKRVFVGNDRFTNGNNVAELLYYSKDNDNKELLGGDEVQVEMQCIDKAVYNYWFTLSEQTKNGPGGGVTPGNPPSNINHNALGYFSAHTTEKVSYKVK